MMNLALSRPQLFVLINYLKTDLRNVYIFKSFRNVLTSNKLISARTDSYYNSFNLRTINKFSTTSISWKNKNRLKDKTKVHVDVNQLSAVIKLEQMMLQFDAAIESFKDQLMKYAVVRSNVGVIEALPITYENDEYRLEELVEISRKPNMIVLNIATFPQIIPTILEALTKSQMNLNPQQEGTTVFIPIPKVTKEYRENLSKNAKQYFTKCKNIISDIRNQYVKELKKKQGIPEDLVFNGENYINAVQREYVDKAEQLLKAKQKDLLG